MSKNHPEIEVLCVALIPPSLLGVNAIIIVITAYGFLGTAFPGTFLALAGFWLLGTVGSVFLIYETLNRRFIISAIWLLSGMLVGIYINYWTAWQISAVI